MTTSGLESEKRVEPRLITRVLVFVPLLSDILIIPIPAQQVLVNDNNSK